MICKEAVYCINSVWCHTIQIHKNLTLCLNEALYRGVRCIDGRTPPFLNLKSLWKRVIMFAPGRLYARKRVLVYIGKVSG